MHAVLSNFNQQPQQESVPTVHNLFFSTLQQFRIELLEVTVIRDEETDSFVCQLLLFDGEKEVQIKSGFIDGVILAKIFACPIYTDEQLIEKYADRFFGRLAPAIPTPTMHEFENKWREVQLTEGPLTRGSSVDATPAKSLI
jgi:hypothetical protein